MIFTPFRAVECFGKYIFIHKTSLCVACFCPRDSQHSTATLYGKAQAWFHQNHKSMIYFCAKSLHLNVTILSIYNALPYAKRIDRLVFMRIPSSFLRALQVCVFGWYLAQAIIIISVVCVECTDKQLSGSCVRKYSFP